MKTVCCRLEIDVSMIDKNQYLYEADSVTESNTEKSLNIQTKQFNDHR